MYNLYRSPSLQKNIHPTVVLLASGGVDSTALLDFYLRKQDEVCCVHYQYGQANAESEKEAYQKVLSYYKVKGTTIDVGFRMKKYRDEVMCRNALFVFITASNVQTPARLALAIHEGTRYYDCTKTFVNDCQNMLDGYFAGTVRVETPFIDFSKRDIINYCKKFDVPTNLTYSCLRQNYVPCGRCSACIDNEGLKRG